MSHTAAVPATSSELDAHLDTDLDTDPRTTAKESLRLGIWVSALRCMLTYVVAPVVGGLSGFLGAAGLSLQILAAGVVTSGALTLWQSGHRTRYLYAVLGAVLVVLLCHDLVALV